MDIKRHTKVFIKKSCTFEISGTHPMISNFYFHFSLRWLHSSIFILAISSCNILSAIFIVIIISVLLSQKILLLLSHTKPTDFIVLDNFQAIFLRRWLDGRVEEKTIFSAFYVINYKNMLFLFVQAWNRNSNVSIFWRLKKTNCSHWYINQYDLNWQNGII